MLNLAPDIEDRVREYAAAEGVSVDELIARTFPPRTPNRKALRLIETIREWQAEDATSDEGEQDRRESESAELRASLDVTRNRAGMRPLFPGQG